MTDGADRAPLQNLTARILQRRRVCPEGARVLRREALADPVQILIRQARQDQGRTSVAKDFTPGLGANSGRGRIVCAVNDRAPVPALKTARPLDGGKAPGNRSRIDLNISGTNG